VAKYKKKRVRELRHDRFRDAAMTVFDRLGDRLEGRGKPILYALAAAVAIGVAIWIGVWRHHKHAEEARQALGFAIKIATAQVSATPSASPTSPSFTSEQDRAQHAIVEFQKVAAKYGEPYRTEAQYFVATSLLYVDRDRATRDLAELSKSSVSEVAALAKFALAQAKEADAKYDEAAQLYDELAKQNSAVVTSDTASLRLALVFKKQGKKKEASDVLFRIVDSARKAKGQDGAPLPQSAAARDAAQELQKFDPERYEQLTPESPAGVPPF
jgi:hypothetical protein